MLDIIGTGGQASYVHISQVTTTIVRIGNTGIRPSTKLQLHSMDKEVQYIPRNMHTVLLCFALL